MSGTISSGGVEKQDFNLVALTIDKPFEYPVRWIFCTIVVAMKLGLPTLRRALFGIFYFSCHSAGQ